EQIFSRLRTFARFERHCWSREMTADSKTTGAGPVEANPADVGSVDAIVSAAYEVVSGKAGESRDWNRLRSLFAPGARLIPTSKQAGVQIPDGKTPEPLDVEAYITRVADYFEKNGFIETEVARRIEQ